MIYVYTGTPGSGKTLGATEFGLHAQKRRGGVVANFDITKAKRWQYLHESRMTAQELMKYGRAVSRKGHESEWLLIIDEAHRILNARAWTERETAAFRRELLVFLAEHRHFGADVILVAQDERMLDKQARFLIEFETRHFKLNQFWWAKWLPVPLFGRVTSNYQFKGAGFRGSMNLSFGLEARGRYDFQAMQNRVSAPSAELGAGALVVPWIQDAASIKVAARKVWGRRALLWSIACSVTVAVVAVVGSGR